MIPGTSETHTEGFPYEIFRHRETKYFQRKIVIPLCIKFFDTPNFLKFWSDVREIFRHCETDIFWRKIVILPPPLPPLIHKFFRYQKFSETKKGSPTKYFRYCETTIFFIENRDIPLLGIKLFDTRNFLRHRRFPRRNFSEMWDENFSTENRDTLLHKVHKSVVELMFVRTFWKLISKQKFCF